jgi:regulator of sigma E protease
MEAFGQNLVAKWCGVKCEKFYVGFDVPIKIFGLQLPSKLVHFQWGETEYGVGIIPLGGYVKMLGQDDDPRAAQAEMERIRVKKNAEGTSSETEGGVSSSDIPNEQSRALASESHSADRGEDEYELDPRSFPAKTVPQRMGIISAGVIMNLIFAVIFATCAFRAGVPYTPCEVGAVVPGSPAWTHGVEAQNRIVEVGQRERRKTFLRFTWDLSNGVNMVGDGEALRIVTQDPDGDERSYDIVPSTIELPGQKRRLLGIAPAQTCKLAASKPAFTGSSAAAATPELIAQFKAIFEVLDANADGKVAFEEITASGKISDGSLAKAIFEALDSDGNFELVVSEYLRGDGTIMAIHATPELTDEAHAIFAELDANADGKLTFEEAVAGGKIRDGNLAQAIFEALDLDHDGELVVPEHLRGGDTIVSVDGTAVHDDAYELRKLMALNIDQPVTLTLERVKRAAGGEPTTTTHDLIVEPNRIRRLGLVMKAGPVVGIRPGSPAAVAGFQVGDQIETIAGQPIGDPMSLPTQLRPHHEQEIEIQVRRNNELVSLDVTPLTPTEFDWTFSENSPMAAIALGLAFQVDREVQAVIPESPAEKAGIKVGDVAVAFEALEDDPKIGLLARLFRFIFGEPEGGQNALKLDDVNLTWPAVFNACQYLPEDFSLNLSMQRDGQVQDFTLKPIATDELNPDRGFRLTLKSETYVARSWGEAASLGAGRTWEDANRVAIFLKKLVSGQIALTNVGGPLIIAAVAGSEASEGLPRLLIFLTFLSANLAVVNFMPIPALDGGHFIFLLWEGISGKPVNERVQIALTLAGVGCLLCLMIFVVGLDINRLFF